MRSRSSCAPTARRPLAANVFGVPTFVMDGQAFWGEDATALFADFVADPELFRQPEMARLETIPVGVSRK